MDEYRPITCAQHSQYELYAMHQTSVLVSYGSDRRAITGIITDIYSSKTGEFLKFKTLDSETLEIRLDQINDCQPQK
jgi:transcriptional antiterminator Rof (Rho-off)